MRARAFINYLSYGKVYLNEMRTHTEVGKIILKLLLVGITLSAATLTPNATGHLVTLFLSLLKEDRSGVQANARRLIRQKLVRITKKDGKEILLLTKRGKQRALIYNVEDLEIPEPKSWDHKWRLVIFDIPNNKKLARETLREKLKELGFFKLQESVFLYPYDCKDQIDYLRQIYEIDLYVKYLVCTDLEDEFFYKTYFKIK